MCVSIITHYITNGGRRDCILVIILCSICPYLFIAIACTLGTITPLILVSVATLIWISVTPLIVIIVAVTIEIREDKVIPQEIAEMSTLVAAVSGAM